MEKRATAVVSISGGERSDLRIDMHFMVTGAISFFLETDRVFISSSVSSSLEQF
jgi:hypothetical protein